MPYQLSLNSATTTVVLPCVQFDEKKRFDLIVQEDLTGKTVQVESETSDSGTVVTNGTVQADGHTVTFYVDKNITYKAGSYASNIVVYDTGMKNRRSYRRLRIDVQKAARNAMEQEPLVSSNWVQEVDDVARLAKARVDVLTALPAGSTAGNAELADIRVNSAGDTATGAGVAVREGDALNAAGISAAANFSGKKVDLDWQTYTQANVGVSKNRIFSKSAFCPYGALFIVKGLGKNIKWWVNYFEDSRERPTIYNTNLLVTDPDSTSRQYAGSTSTAVTGDGYLRLEKACVFEITACRVDNSTLTDADVARITASITVLAAPGKVDRMASDSNFTEMSSDDLEYVKYNNNEGRPRLRYQAVFVPKGSVIAFKPRAIEKHIRNAFDELAAIPGEDSLAKRELKWPPLGTVGWKQTLYYEIKQNCYFTVYLRNETDTSLDSYTPPAGLFTIYYDKNGAAGIVAQHIVKPYLTEAGKFVFPAKYNPTSNDGLYYFKFGPEPSHVYIGGTDNVRNAPKSGSLTNDNLGSIPEIKQKDFNGETYFALPPNNFLWFDTFSGTFGVTTLNNLKSVPGKFSLLEARFGQMAGGYFGNKFCRDYEAQKKAEEASSGFLSSEYSNEPGIAAALTKLNAAYAGVQNGEAYLFFTDPHTFQHVVNEESMEISIGTIEQGFNRSLCEFVLCGGDWLQEGDNQGQGVEKLARINGMMRAKFGDNYYPILGNHDTNYQGVNAAGEANTGSLPQPVIDRLFFGKYGKAYYDFVTNGGTRFYVFDSGIDWTSGNMNDYQWTQAQSFAQALLDNDDPHSVIAIHMITNQAQAAAESGFIAQAFSERLLAIAQAYNARGYIGVNGQAFNFASCTGKVAYAICGHTHYDLTTVYKDIPILITRNATYAAHFDYVLVDYAAGKLKTYRVGDGEDREIDIIV